MRKINRILNPVADEFFRSGIFQMNLFSMVFWCVIFTGTAVGFHLGAWLGAAIGSALGFAVGSLFIVFCYSMFHFLIRIGWVVLPKDRRNERVV